MDIAEHYEDEMIIKTDHLTKIYGEKKAVSDLSLEIRKGEIFGLLGPNGAGKTTTTLMLLGTDGTYGRKRLDRWERLYETGYRGKTDGGISA